MTESAGDVLQFEILSFSDKTPVPDEFALCKPDPGERIAMSDNQNPHLKWSNLPEGTKSLALICVDPDAPTEPDDVNQEGRTVSADLERTDFFHWVLVDIPTDINEIGAGAVSDGVTPGGKDAGRTKYGVRGLNSYTQWFAGDEDMEGEYGGYDGPCPPWNDELVHRYYFRLYALDVSSLGLTGSFEGSDALNAMNGHILGQAEWMGTFTLNPGLR